MLPPWHGRLESSYRAWRITLRNDASPGDTIQAVYKYTYDDGDNMTTKVTPFEDNFDPLSAQRSISALSVSLC